MERCPARFGARAGRPHHAQHSQRPTATCHLCYPVTALFTGSPICHVTPPTSGSDLPERGGAVTPRRGGTRRDRGRSDAPRPAVIRFRPPRHGTAAPQRAETASNAPSNRPDKFDADAQTNAPDADTIDTDPADPPDERSSAHPTLQSFGTRSCQSRARTPPQPARRHAAPHAASRSWSDARSALTSWPRSSIALVRLWPCSALLRWV